MIGYHPKSKQTSRSRSEIFSCSLSARGDKALSERQNNNLSEFIAENFGANATYVEGLLGRFRSDPSLVDEAWRAYFTEMLGEAPATQAAGANGGAGASPSRTGGDNTAAAADAWP